MREVFFLLFLEMGSFGMTLLLPLSTDQILWIWLNTLQIFLAVFCIRFSFLTRIFFLWIALNGDIDFSSREWTPLFDAFHSSVLEMVY